MSSSNEKRSLIASFLARKVNGYDTIDAAQISPSVSTGNRFVYEDGPEFSKMPGNIKTVI